MAWSRINVGSLTQAINTNSVPLTVNYAASGILAGDILIYFASNNNTTETITWSNTPTQLAFNSSTTTRGIWASIATGSENGGNVTITGSSAGRMQGVIFTYRGGPATLTGITNDSQNAGGSAALGLSWPTLTPTVDNCLCLFMGGKSNTNITGYSNGPATELLDVTSGATVSMVIEESIQTTATTINTGSWTIAGDGSASRRCLAVALIAGVVAPIAVADFSGGFLYEYERDQRRRRKRQLEQEALEEEAHQLQDKVDAEIAVLLHRQEAQAERVAELERLQTLVRAHSKSQLQLSDRAQIAYVRALTQANFSAMEALDRELRRMIDEEEITALMILLNED